MVSTFKRMLTVNLGYDHHNVLAGEIALSGNEYSKAGRAAGFANQLMQNVSSLPGIKAAAICSSLGEAQAMSIERREQPRPGEPRPDVRAVTPQYLQAMRLPLLEGRWVAETPLTVVLSASVARHYWPHGSPIGQRVKFGSEDKPWLTVVGVAGDVNDWFFGNPQPAAYVSYRQFPQTSMGILLRTDRDAAGTASGLRLAVQAVDRDQPVYNVQTLDQRILEETSGVSNAARMMSTYAAIALLLSVTGIYSISSFFVAQRTREIGVRMSLGASRGSILKMVLAQSSTLTGSGLLLGLPLAILLTVGMSRALYNVVSLQSLTFVLVMAILGGAAALAGYIPALRAARVDPMVALRHE
jgi:putative ABC transport system permease protein